jgi:hypothetical protein
MLLQRKEEAREPQFLANNGDFSKSETEMSAFILRRLSIIAILMKKEGK